MRDADPTPVLELREVVRTFGQGDRAVHVLKGASARLMPGQAVALVGKSGTGKSTFLHIAGLLESPNSGEVLFNARNCSRMPDDERTRVRRSDIGFIYQFHQLLPEFSALENVALPQMIQGKSRKAAEAHAREMLTGLGLGDRVDHRPAELSGGEQQRTAIARALANSPRLLLADEPTGNLDPTTADGVFAELISLIERTGVAALIATHSMDLARRMHRVLQMKDGQLRELSPTELG